MVNKELSEILRLILFHFLYFILKFHCHPFCRQHLQNTTSIIFVYKFELKFSLEQKDQRKSQIELNPKTL